MCLGAGGRGGRYEGFKSSSWNWKINRKIKEDQGGDKHCEQTVGAWERGSAVFVMSLFDRSGTGGSGSSRSLPHPLPAINPTLTLSLLTLYQISEQKTSLSQRCWEQINNKRMIYFTWWFVLKLSICFL